MITSESLILAVAFAVVLTLAALGLVFGLGTVYDRFVLAHPPRDYMKRRNIEERRVLRERDAVEKRNLCPCGATGKTEVTDYASRMLGYFQPVERRCDEHRMIPGGVLWVDGQPQTEPEIRRCTLAGTGREGSVIMNCECDEHLGMEIEQWRAGTRWRRKSSPLSLAV